MSFKIAEFVYFESEFLVKIFIYRNIYNLISSKIYNIGCKNKNPKSFWFFKLFNSNGIGADGSGKLGEGLSKLLNLTSLNLNFS